MSVIDTDKPKEWMKLPASGNNDRQTHSRGNDAIGVSQIGKGQAGDGHAADAVGSSKSRQTATRRFRPRRWWIWIAGLTLLLFAALNYTWESTGEPPKYYAELLPENIEDMIENALEFDSKVESLNNQVVESARGEDLQISFSQDEINSWLQHSLPQRAAGKLPRQLKEIRVRLDATESSLVMKIDAKYFRGYVTVDFDVAIGTQPNELQITLKQIYSGIATLPFTQFRQQIVEGVNNAGVEIRWPENQSPTVVSLDLDDLMTDQVARPVSIQKVTVADQQLIIDYQFSE